MDGSLLMAEHGPWRADINYLYYNPQWTTHEAQDPLAQAAVQEPETPSKISFRDWPALQLCC